ncbi:MAG: hypothetical protein M3539_07090 [Acidobacteriota bacterium]|nr:hypothetical protein [Acidobacteriota bacterium]
MNNRFAHHFHLRKGKKGDTAQLAAQLAPLEEQSGHAKTELGIAGASQEHGAIVVDSASGNLSKDIMEGGYEKTLFGMEPVVLVILGVMLAFIAFIAWQISQMPAE